MAERNPGKICHTCGGTSNLELIVTCDKCKKISYHVYCMNLVPHEIPEWWYCEECIDHEKASNDLNGNFVLDRRSLKRGRLEFVPLKNARAQPQTGKMKFIPEREITLLNNKRSFTKRSAAEEQVQKTRDMIDLLGLCGHNKKKELTTTGSMIKEASQGNRELEPQKEMIINLPVSEAVWKGMINYIHLVKHTHDVQAHLAEMASPKVKEISKEIPQKLSLQVKLISEFWPEAFKLQSPSHEDIGLYFFSSESDRNKEKFHRMIERLYKRKQVLVGRIDTLCLYLFPSQILPKYNQCINGEYYLWGLLHRYKRKVLNQAPVTCTTTNAKGKNPDCGNGSSQVKPNEIDVDMEIDMIGGVELGTTPIGKFASQPDPIVPPGFCSSHLGSNNPRNHNSDESDRILFTTSPGSQLSSSEWHVLV